MLRVSLQVPRNSGRGETHKVFSLKRQQNFDDEKQGPFPYPDSAQVPIVMPLADELTGATLLTGDGVLSTARNLKRPRDAPCADCESDFVEEPLQDSAMRDHKRRKIAKNAVFPTDERTNALQAKDDVVSWVPALGSEVVGCAHQVLPFTTPQWVSSPQAWGVDDPDL